MPRYLVERDFTNGFDVSVSADGVAAVHETIRRNTNCGVTWIRSFVSDDKRKTWCIYDGPNPEAIRRAAEHNDLPIGKITRVTVLDPYFSF